MDMNQKKRLYSLLNALREEMLTDDQFSELEYLVSNDFEAAQEYVLYVKLWTDLQYFRSANSESSIRLTTDSVPCIDKDFWQAMANYEKTAPNIEIPKEKPQVELIQKVIYPPCEKRKMGKFSKAVLIVNAAAMLFLILFIKYAPPKGEIEVATLTDSINAQWVGFAGSTEKGRRLPRGSEWLFLKQGYAQLLFDTDAQVVIEGPAEFRILAEDRIGLNYGKVYMRVPQGALGFSVYTQNVKIIDLGTEFGVELDSSGVTRLHVIKGKTVLIAGLRSDKMSIEVGKGEAKKVSAMSSEISDVSCDPDLFVRNINSEVGVVWRGQRQIDLADLIGGGNGFGTGQLDMTIDPISGKLTRDILGRRESVNDYHPVPSSSYIDGVFVPNGREQQIISSQAHQFRECPVTTSLCYDNIRCEQSSLDLITTQNSTGSVLPSGYNLAIHANMGITFDLQAIRGLLPDTNIVRFQSKLGLKEGSVRPSISNADFWILVDGELRYRKEQVKAGELYSVDIELSENDRFLTLIETDGGDPGNRTLDGVDVPAIDSDWGIFVNPVLIIE